MGLLLTALFIFFSFKPAIAVRPFVTDDAHIVDKGQVTVEFWGEKTDNKNLTPTLNLLLGSAVSQWLELSVAGGTDLKRPLGKDFHNPVLQSKILFTRSDPGAVPGYGLALGYITPSGAGASRIIGSSIYAIGLLTKRFYDDVLIMHLNLGATQSWSEMSSGAVRAYWGSGFEFPVLEDEWDGVAEVFSGDPYAPIRASIAAQTGIRWVKKTNLNFDFVMGGEPGLSEDGSKRGSTNTWIQVGLRAIGDFYTEGKGRPEGGDGIL